MNSVKSLRNVRPVRSGIWDWLFGGGHGSGGVAA
jgi:hypothetical protein